MNIYELTIVFLVIIAPAIILSISLLTIIICAIDTIQFNRNFDKRRALIDARILIRTSLPKAFSQNILDADFSCNLS